MRGKMRTSTSLWEALITGSWDVAVEFNAARHTDYGSCDVPGKEEKRKMSKMRPTSSHLRGGFTARCPGGLIWGHFEGPRWWYSAGAERRSQWNAPFRHWGQYKKAVSRSNTTRVDLFTMISSNFVFVSQWRKDACWRKVGANNSAAAANVQNLHVTRPLRRFWCVDQRRQTNRRNREPASNHKFRSVLKYSWKGEKLLRN
jgi:hypothetical protein